MTLTLRERAAVTRALLRTIRDGAIAPADKRHAVTALRKVDPEAADTIADELAMLGLSS